ncbi:LacI family DNA-binding transcriptional regulator [Cognatiyoonia sp. IB215182]|uniref:LacI family DNA-binding transcriptional regulator n=1 Tax=Cognatiyoonia sp. IB215182 TaxID=3097353 RepID=UPI002A0B2CDF|nr:LacI family DNA-binding transcriptional regulator [Cognatiyoonia sp. IB215182]MDX8354507.1 LacI family DNA-binding transcriptional regulator [Cognatiyoonia sp. IB215182]
MQKRATIEDVARIAGVSTATVSRAIHTPDVVSDSTRKAVNGAIDETGFTLNQAARNLRQQRANAIMVLVPDIGNTFFSEILAGIERVASSAGQTILIGHTAKDPLREEKYLNSLINGQADGALLLNGHLPSSFVHRIKGTSQKPLPIVSVSEALEDQIVPHVGTDNARAAETATTYLLEKGHRHILHLRGPLDNILTHQRMAGFQNAMEKAGQIVSPASYIAGDFSIESGIAAADQLLAATEHPDAVFCANDEMAIGLMSQLAAHGVKVPQHISVIGFDDIAFAATASPGLTTIAQPRSAFGERSMHILLDLIQQGGVATRTEEILGFHLIERASVETRGRD